MERVAHLVIRDADPVTVRNEIREARPAALCRRAVMQRLSAKMRQRLLDGQAELANARAEFLGFLNVVALGGLQLRSSLLQLLVAQAVVGAVEINAFITDVRFEDGVRNSCR